MRFQKITFKDMRQMGVHGVLIYCADYRCSHFAAGDSDRWPDKERWSDIEPRFVSSACDGRDAEVRPGFKLK